MLVENNPRAINLARFAVIGQERDLQVALDEMDGRVAGRSRELEEANTALRVLVDHRKQHVTPKG